MYMNAWTGFFQFFLGLASAPLAILLEPSLSIDTLIPHMINGFKCFLLEQDTLPSDNCTAHWGARLTVLLYMAINIIYNILLLLVLKHGSATLLYISSTVMVPTVSLCQTMTFLLGPSAHPLSPYNIAGLLAILTGLLTYRSAREKVGPKGEEEALLGSEVTFTAPGREFIVGPALQPGQFPILPKTTDDIRRSYLLMLGIPPSSRRGSTETTASSSYG